MYPVCFHFDSLEIRSYVVAICLAFLIAAWLAARRASALGLTAGQVAVLGSVTLVVVVAGARLGFVLDSWETFEANPAKIFWLWDGGVTLYGGGLLSLLAVAGVLHCYRKPILPILDGTVRYLVLAVAITRVGCFLNGCCAGDPTNLPWGVVYPSESVYRHPTQIYEGAGLLFHFFLLKRLERRNPPAGTLLFLSFLYYGVMRFGLEFIREDARPGPLWLSSAQWISFVIVVWGVMELRRRRLWRKG